MKGLSGSCSRSRRGFTLVELLIAVLISSVVGFIVVSSLVSFLSSQSVVPVFSEKGEKVSFVESYLDSVIPAKTVVKNEKEVDLTLLNGDKLVLLFKNGIFLFYREGKKGKVVLTSFPLKDFKAEKGNGEVVLTFDLGNYKRTYHLEEN